MQDVPDRDEHVLGDRLESRDALHDVGRDGVGQRRQHLARLSRRKVREHDRDRLRVLVDEHLYEGGRRNSFEARREEFAARLGQPPEVAVGGALGMRRERAANDPTREPLAVDGQRVAAAQAAPGLLVYDRCVLARDRAEPRDRARHLPHLGLRQVAHDGGRRLLPQRQKQNGGFLRAREKGWSAGFHVSLSPATIHGRAGRPARGFRA